MKHIFEPATAAEVKARLMKLRPDSPRQWGKMDPAQMVTHCARGLTHALGDEKPPRLLVGRVIGWAIKSKVLGDEKPLGRNSPTMPEMMVADARELETERARLFALLDRLVAGGPTGCTTHPHGFFGRMTGQEWGVLIYKHLDHHLRQFGV